MEFRCGSIKKSAKLTTPATMLSPFYQRNSNQIKGLFEQNDNKHNPSPFILFAKFPYMEFR